MVKFTFFHRIGGPFLGNIAGIIPQVPHNIMSTSIRNRLPGTIEQIVSDKVVSEIVINTAAGPVTSIITTGSVKRMNLKKGDAVFAIIKATEVSVEAR